jgi:Lipid A core - O-antigen ligase and related enzymes
MIERRGFRIGFATLALFTTLAGDAWRYSITWYGWGVIVLGLAIGTGVLLVHNRARLRQLPYPMLAFLILATASIAWSFYPGLTALGALSQWLTTAGAVAIAVILSWEELLTALGLALRLVLGLSIVFELVVSVFIRHRILPLWVDYGDTEHLPKLLFWSRNLLFVTGKIQGIVGNSSTLAIIALFGLIVFGIQLASRTVRRTWGIVWLLLAAAIVVFTRSGTIYVAVVVCAVVLAAILVLRRARARRRTKAAYWSVGAFFAACGVFVAVFNEQLLQLIGKNDTLTGRDEIWRAVIDLAQQRPVQGWGWISYWAPWVEPFKDLVKRAGVQQLHAHNAWLDVWLQLGLIGVAIFLALVLTVVARSWMLAVHRPQDAVGASLLPILILAALLVQSFAESRILVEYGWVLLTVLAVKTKASEPVPLAARRAGANAVT